MQARMKTDHGHTAFFQVRGKETEESVMALQPDWGLQCVDIYETYLCALEAQVRTRILAVVMGLSQSRMKNIAVTACRD